MTTARSTLPTATAQLFLTDGGLETTLIFLEGYELPSFAAFDLLKDEKGCLALKTYFRRYLDIAKEYKTNFILESPTWRASPDWLESIGYPPSALADINRKAIELLIDLKKEYEKDIDTVIISGCVGPRGDGYKPGNTMTANEALSYHAAQIEVFSRTAVDMISAITMNYLEEAIGIGRAAGAINLPVVISFTVETNGKLPTGMSLKEAIEQVDSRVSPAPLYYMINCAHPSHFFNELKAEQNEPWIKRIRGVRANASCKSHAELDEATSLDRGNPQELGNENRKLKEIFGQLNVFGGCCGTDEEHILAIAKQLVTVH